MSVTQVLLNKLVVWFDVDSESMIGDISPGPGFESFDLETGEP